LYDGSVNQHERCTVIYIGFIYRNIYTHRTVTELIIIIIVVVVVLLLLLLLVVVVVVVVVAAAAAAVAVVVHLHEK